MKAYAVKATYKQSAPDVYLFPTLETAEEYVEYRAKNFMAFERLGYIEVKIFDSPIENTYFLREFR